MGHSAKPKYGRIPAMLRLWSFSPTTVPASSSHMLCPSIGQSQASTTPISWSPICAVRCRRRDQPHFLGENTPNILHDNSRPHVADVVKQLLAQWQWEVLYHPSYSSDISPCDFDLIPKVKEQLRGRRFKTIPDIIDATGRSVRTTNKIGAAKGNKRLPHRW